MPKDTGFLLSSPELDGAEADMCHPAEVPSPSMEDEVYLPINHTSGDKMPVGMVWRQIQGAFPCCSSILGVLSQSPCLRNSPMIVRMGGWYRAHRPR